MQMERDQRQIEERFFGKISQFEVAHDNERNVMNIASGLKGGLSIVVGAAAGMGAIACVLCLGSQSMEHSRLPSVLRRLGSSRGISRGKG